MRRLLPFLFLSPLLFGQIGTTMTVQNGGGTVTFPATATVVLDQPTALDFMATPLAGNNTLNYSCSGPGIAPGTAGVLDLGNGAVKVTIVITATLIGASNDACQWTFGMKNGPSSPALASNFTLNAVPKTDDAAFALNQGDPISTATGELHHAPPADLSLGGPLPVEFRRYYASELRANGVTTHIGNNWMHNFDWLLTFTETQATLTRFGGRPIVFQLSGTVWQPVNREQYGYQLVSVGTSSYQFLDPRTNLIYSFNGTATSLGLSSIQDRNGNTIAITAPANGSNQVSDGLGRSLTLNYDANNRLTRVTDQAGRSVSYFYNTSGDLTQIADANGKVELFGYTVVNNFPGQMTSHTLPLGNQPFAQTWDALARVAKQTDSRGNPTAFTYDQPQGSSSYADPLGVVVADTNRNYSDLLTYTDADNQTASITYDNNQRRLSVIDRLGDKTARTYHAASGYVASQTDAAGNLTTFTWTAQTQGPFTFYVLTVVQYADGSSVSIAYDNFGNPTSLTDQAGKVWKYAYNNRGQRTAVTDPAGRSTTYNYTAGDATLASMTDAAGNVTLYSYDVLKRVNQIKFADGSTRSIAYDNRDNVLRITDERGKTSTFAFNDNNRAATATDALGKTAATAYDTDERVSKRTGRNGQSTAYAYDVTGFLQQMTAPAGEVITFSHDKHNRLSAGADSSGKGVSFGYDKEDVLASVTDALARKTTFSTDKLGHTTQVTSPLGESTVLARDKLERLTSETDPTLVATSFNYDPRGSLSRIAVGNSVVSIAHDDANLITGIADPNGSLWSFGYDTAGRLQSRADPLGRTTSYSFDKRNRVTSVRTGVGSATLAYDAAGNLIGRQYSDGTNLSYTFDDDNRPTGGTGVSLTLDAEGGITASNGLLITRDADGRIASVVYGPSKAVTYHYNAQGLLDSMTDWLNGMTAFTYDAARVLIGIHRPNGRGTQFVYDGDGRIQSINEDNGASIVITRDAAGRPVSETRSQPSALPLAAGVLPLAYDAASQVSGSTYDNMGRLTADGLRTYKWNLASQMTWYAGNDGSATAVYDAFGLRTSRTTPAGTQSYVWNYATTLPSLAIVQDAAGDRRYYIYLPDGSLLYAIDAGTGARHYYHFDETGSTAMLTDDRGATTDTYAYTPFGETAAQTGATENPFTWQGQNGVMQEGATSLYYMRARYYDSATSRFLSPDPVVSAYPLEANPYQYARANPLTFADPRGLNPNTVVRPEVDAYLRALGPRNAAAFSNSGCCGRGDLPRFIDTSSQPNLYNIQVCQAGVLFPFVTQASGFDTGANASAITDPFGAPPSARTSPGLLLPNTSLLLTPASAPAVDPATVSARQSPCISVTEAAPDPAVHSPQ